MRCYGLLWIWLYRRCICLTAIPSYSHWCLLCANSIEGPMSLRLLCHQFCSYIEQILCYRIFFWHTNIFRFRMSVRGLCVSVHISKLIYADICSGTATIFQIAKSWLILKYADAVSDLCISYKLWLIPLKILLSIALYLILKAKEITFLFMIDLATLLYLVWALSSISSLVRVSLYLPWLTYH